MNLRGNYFGLQVLGQILEINKNMNSVVQQLMYQGLIQFDYSYISSSVQSGIIQVMKYYLNLYDVSSTELKLNNIIRVHD